MEPKKKIVFATDLSKDFLIALEYAIDYAEKSSSNLIVLHVVGLSSLLTDQIATLTGKNLTDEDDVQSNSTSLLSTIKQRITSCPDITVKYQVLHGNLVNATMQYIQQAQPDLLILTATDVSTAYKCADCSPIPTITISVNSDFRLIKTILYPVSDKFYTTYKTDEIVRISKIYNAKVIVLGVSANNGESLDTVNFYMESVISKLSNQNVDIQSNLEISEDYTEAISKFATQHKIDLISVISNYETGFLSLFYKTPDEKLIKSSELPVLSIPVVIDTTPNEDITADYISPWSMKYDINSVSLGIKI